MMTIPGLALFYGGLVRSKNVLSTLMHSFFCAALISVTWVLFGYSMAFGPDIGGIVGGAANFGLRGILGTANSAAPTIPQMVFVAFQATFAIITPALISGTFAERLRFPAFALYMLLWSTFIYNPLAHWVWGGGWIASKVGAIDFAGGTVVHISSGVSALVTALYLGKRVGYPETPMPPHNLPFCGRRRVVALGRMVRVQRGQRHLFERARRLRLRQHQHGSRRGGARLDVRRMVTIAASRRSSARRPARSPAWWPSRPPRDS